jgi:hypothetical protein
MDDEQIIGILHAHVKENGRDRDIRRAVAAARGYANGELASGERQVLWPAADYKMAADIVLNSQVTLEKLRKAWPAGFGDQAPSSEKIIDFLFPGDPLLCVGQRKEKFWTEPREFWRGRESTFEFIVPNPMKARWGKTKEGKLSQRCLDITGEREFLVIEFDMAEDGPWKKYIEGWQAKGISTFDAQAALLVYLATRDLPRFSLVLAVHSGGKSLHGWYPCKGLEERQPRAFMERAVRLGADRATWTKCQLVRMPGGTRENGNRQWVE